MNEKRIDMILENSYNRSFTNLYSVLLESGGTDIELENGKRFITESILELRTLMIEENIVQNVRDNLGGYAAAAGLGAGGMYLYDKYNDPTLLDQVKEVGGEVVDAAGNLVPTETAPATEPVPTAIADSTDLSAELIVGNKPELTIYEAAISQVLPLVMENTGDSLKAKLISRTILNNGAISLTEADYICGLVDQVLTEAADEFIPDEIEVEDEADNVDVEPMELFDADGNKYIFADGVLTPAEVSGDMGEMGDPAAEPAVEPVLDDAPVVEPAGEPVVDAAPAGEPVVDAAPAGEPVVDADNDGDTEKDEDKDGDNDGDKKQVEESTIINEPKLTLLTESSNIVERILHKMSNR
jgi:hypothetical protein